MLIAALLISCYLPNSTFAYNPATKQGVLKATFGAYDSISTEICQTLDGKLVRAKIYLTGGEFLFSTTFSYHFGAYIAVSLTAATTNAHDQAYVTTESTFELEFLELAESIKYTLASYQLYNFDVGSCITNLKYNRAIANVELYGALEQCDLSITDFATSNYAMGEVILNNFGTFYFDVSAAISAAISDVNNVFRATFDCTQLATAHVSMCEQINERVTKNTLYELFFKVHFRLSYPAGKQFTITSQIYAVLDPQLVGCFTGEYAVSDGIAIIDITRDTTLPSCMLTYDEAYIQGGYLENLMYSQGRYWFFNMSVTERLEEKFRFYIECRSFLDENQCITYLSYLLRLNYSWFKFRTFFVYQNKDYNFLGLTLTRKEWCYASVNATLKYNADGYAIVTVGFYKLESSYCGLTQQVRTLLYLYIYEKRNEFFGSHTKDFICLLSTRKEFSIANDSVDFALETGYMKVLLQLASKKRLAAYFLINQIEIPITQIQDKLSEDTRAYATGIALGYGLLLGIVGFLMNWLFGNKLYPKEKQQAL